jgi:hypothetical protein
MLTLEWLPCSDAADYEIEFLLELKRALGTGRGKGFLQCGADICKAEAEALIQRLTRSVFGKRFEGATDLGYAYNVKVVEEGPKPVSRVRLKILCPVGVDPFRFAERLKDEWEDSRWAARISFCPRQRDSWLNDFRTNPPYQMYSLTTNR